MHAETLVEYPSSLRGDDGKLYLARACGRMRSDGLWEGWIEFERDDGEVAVRTARETTQPNRTDLAYWANGLTAVYLEGAFRRAVEGPPVVEMPIASPPRFDGPKRPIEPVLDPFDAYASGEVTLRRRLSALASWHLRNIARAYGIIGDAIVLESLTKTELVDVIVEAARRRAGREATAPASHR